ncbi:MAG: long-chain fatty acid--CoA ligase [Rhodospirillaceae bacterium]|nr:long-chain fatty acid--CoA ligase [Rhodospirillaceae bacterium]|tara:strand:+ start:3313 stop:5103 length:1791 start_codon:yes stop_codon:yes gene_type:complete
MTEETKNLVALFYDQATQKGDAPFLWCKQDGDWKSVSWAAAASQVSALASALKGLGIETGDRVGLISESRPEWPIADLAIMAAGGITVPAYITNGVADHQHVLSDSGASAVIVSTAELAEKVLPAAKNAGGVKCAITMEAIADDQTSGIPTHLWESVIAAQGGDTAALEAAARDLDRGSTACLIYTSGTGGTPKGVMLSHGAILCNCTGSTEMLKEMGLDDEVFLSFLPLSHSYEHTAGQFFPIMIGAQIYYAEGIDKLAQNMAEVHPTLMTAVPRLYEVMHDRIRRGVKQAGGLSEKLFEKTVALGRKEYEDPSSLSLGERIQNALMTKLVRAKVKGRFGGRLKALISGGAPLNYDIGIFFTALGVRLLQGYGQTESAPVISCNPPSHNRIETVGVPMQDVECRIADDGEIVVRGELVMQGYWNNPDATAEAVKDGWLHTGDIGEFDPDGHLRITDRKKDIIVNSGGDNIAPQRIEGMLTSQSEIGQAMVYGDKRPHLVALIVPDADFAAAWAKEQGFDSKALDAVIEDPNFKSLISDAVDRVSGDLSVIEKVRRFTLTAEAFTIDNGMMTPTLKIRRHIIREKYGETLEALYGR